jgi:hypothetical protein
VTLALEAALEQAVAIEYSIAQALGSSGCEIFTRCETSKRVPQHFPITVEESHA